jgi:D-alanine-D-alanine ligase
MNMKKNIAVIFGGKSTEHDISVITACQVLSALDKELYNIFPIYINSAGKWFLGESFEAQSYANLEEKKLKEVAILPCSKSLYIKKFGMFKMAQKIDCAIVACHGKNGEDGTVQGLLELAEIPYTSGGVLSSAVGIDKIAMKKFFVACKIPVCEFVSVSKKEYEEGGTDYILKKIGLPVIVKPNTLGSSIGISVAKSVEDLQNAVELAFLFDDKIVVEKLVENLKEINISVLGNGEDCVCSVTEEPLKSGEFLTFASKYLSSGGTKQSCNVKLNDNANQNSAKKQNIEARECCGARQNVVAKQSCNAMLNDNANQNSAKKQNIDARECCGTKKIVSEKQCCGARQNVEVSKNDTKKCCECKNSQVKQNIDASKNKTNNDYNKDCCAKNAQSSGDTDLGFEKDSTKHNGMQNLGRIVPANITQREELHIKKLACKVFSELGAKGVVRIDFMMDSETRKIYVNEINTIPGSFAFYLWEYSDIKFDELLNKIIEIAENDAQNKQKLTTTFSSSVLNNNVINK